MTRQPTKRRLQQRQNLNQNHVIQNLHLAMLPNSGIRETNQPDGKIRRVAVMTLLDLLSPAKKDGMEEVGWDLASPICKIWN
jgi:hypothetical protein